MRSSKKPQCLWTLILVSLNLLFLAILAVPARGQTLEILHDFSCQADDGCGRGRLIQATDGNLYGTSSNGGQFNQGVVFKLSLDGSTFQVFHSFQCVANDGCDPGGGVSQASDGNLYGTTSLGGQFNEGTIYKISLDGSGFQFLHSFQCAVNNGCNPNSRLIQANDGNLYGTTRSGGQFGAGTVYKIALDGSGFQVLHSFQCFVDTNGCYPTGNLIQASDGNLYGTTDGTGNPKHLDDSELFRIALDGSDFRIVYTFTTSSGHTPCLGPSQELGCAPSALIQASDGNLYGTTQYGGFLGGARSLRSLRTAPPFKVSIAFNVLSRPTAVILWAV